MNIHLGKIHLKTLIGTYKMCHLSKLRSCYLNTVFLHILTNLEKRSYLLQESKVFGAEFTHDSFKCSKLKAPVLLTLFQFYCGGIGGMGIPESGLGAPRFS